MILGVLSDTHGRVATAAAGVRQLLDAGAEFILHCGDVGAGVLELLPSGRAAFVFGNCDHDLDALRHMAQLVDVRCCDAHGKLAFEGRPVTLTHGDEPAVIDAVLRANAPGYLFTGHTHVARDVRVGNVRWINPGALQRAARKTVATLDLATDELTYHEVSG